MTISYIGRDKYYYSVPFTYVGGRVKVIYKRSKVYIYASGRQVAVRIRSLSARRIYDY
ncbi:Mu transposase domain-containing protein [Pedobacter cryoconitis]|uniref:Mu transposase domain-containing protein n=1 Tax=Pedobacter cryoconitis TaxID=188932 RepID=UPI0037428D30